MLKIKSFISFALLCAGATTALAEQILPLTDAPVNIYADHMKYDIKSGVSEYKGNVRVTQNTIELTGDRVTAIHENGVSGRQEQAHTQ